MRYFQDVGAAIAQQTGDIAEYAWLICDHNPHRNNLLFMFEASNDNRGQHARIYIPAREYDGDFPALEAVRLLHDGGQTRRASAFCHGFLDSEQGADSVFKCSFVNENNVGYQIPDNR